MTLRMSDALVNFLQIGGSFKEAMNDSKIDVYSGPQPASPNNPPTGVKLMEITLNGNSYGVSVARKDSITVSSHVSGDVYGVVIGGVTYNYTAQVTDTSNEMVAEGLAAVLNTSGVVFAVTNGSGVIIIIALFPGNDYGTPTFSGTGSGGLATANLTANARGNGLQFGNLSAAGVLQKEAGNWVGIGLGTTGVVIGTAGWWRMKASPVNNGSGAVDNDLQDSIAQFLRMDGACNSANSELLALSTLNIVGGAQDTIPAFPVTLPSQ